MASTNSTLSTKQLAQVLHLLPQADSVELKLSVPVSAGPSSPPPPDRSARVELAGSTTT
jgi:hypothetical protein